jgi:hypothetical protein
MGGNKYDAQFTGISETAGVMNAAPVRAVVVLL